MHIAHVFPVSGVFSWQHFSTTYRLVIVTAVFYVCLDGNVCKSGSVFMTKKLKTTTGKYGFRKKNISTWTWSQRTGVIFRILSE